MSDQRPVTTSDEKSTRAGNTTTKGTLQAYDIRLPCDEQVWNKARPMLPDPKSRMNEIAALLSKDPACVVEFLRISSTMHYSNGKPPVATMKAAIERLGAEAAVQTLEEIKSFQAIDNPRVEKCYEMIRKLGSKASQIATVIAEQLYPTLRDDCQVAGSLIYVGELLAIIHFSEVYADLFEKNNHTKVLYRLEKDFGWSCTKMGVTYLRKLGIPEVVLFALDEQSQVKSPSRAPIKTVVSATVELINAAESGRWPKYAPGQTLPSKSALRLLKMNESQYSNIYERVGEIVNSEPNDR